MTTPRRGLYRPLGTDRVDVTAHISDQMAIIDDSAGAKSVLSTSRPDPAFDGQIIFETDTNSIRIRDDAALTWQFIAFVDERRPRGHVAFGSRTDDSALANNGEEVGPYISLTFDAEQDRRYRFIYVIAIDAPDGSGIADEGGVTIHVRKAQGSSVGKTDDIHDIERVHYADDASGLAKEACIISDEFFLSASGQWTFGLFLKKDGANEMQINGNYNVFFIEDVGAV